MQTWQHALQSACKLVGLWRHAHANSRGLVATRMQTRSPAHCNQPTHCAIRSQTAGFGMQTRRPLAILCIDLTLLHLDLAYQPAGFATSLHTRAFASRLACDGGLWLCTQPASAAPHLQTVARTSCKLSSAQQHFAYGLHKFALRLQQSIRSSHSACIRLCVRASILHMAAFGFALALPLRRLAALRMQAACKLRVLAVCHRLAFCGTLRHVPANCEVRNATRMQTCGAPLQAACKPARQPVQAVCKPRALQFACGSQRQPSLLCACTFHLWLAMAALQLALGPRRSLCGSHSACNGGPATLLSSLQTVASALQSVCKLRTLSCNPCANCKARIASRGQTVQTLLCFAELCAGLASLQLIDALARINFAYVMESQAHLLDCANSQARHKVSHCYAG